MKDVRKYAGAVLPALVFVLVNLYHWFRPVTCWDCFFPYGLPFTFFTEGGYAGGGGIVWMGVLFDLLSVAVACVVFQSLWAIVRRQSISH
jgi:hypothetical protein